VLVSWRGAPKSYNEIAGTNVGTYENAVGSRPAPDIIYGRLLPDMPTGEVVYTNPALTPAPKPAPPAERIPVPVINDPGLIGFRRPSLHEINVSARRDWAARGGRHHFAVTYEKRGQRPVVDDTDAITEESHQEAITRAAQARMAKLNAKVGK
jgi:hypothetical protein